MSAETVADVFALVRSLGTKVVEVPGLDTPIVYVHAHDVALVRPGLDVASLGRLADWLLPEVLDAAIRRP